MIKDFLALSTFLRLGEEKCPRCGMISDPIRERMGREVINFLRCPGCETEFTRELIINLGTEDKRDLLKHN